MVDSVARHAVYRNTWLVKAMICSISMIIAQSSGNNVMRSTGVDRSVLDSSQTSRVFTMTGKDADKLSSRPIRNVFRLSQNPASNGPGTYYMDYGYA